MQGQIDLTLTVTTAGKAQTFSLGAMDLGEILGNTNSYASVPPAFTDLYVIASQHPSYKVRQRSLGSLALPIEAVLAMVNDPSLSVRSSLVSLDMFRRAATVEMVLQLIASDPELAEAVANSVDSFESAGVDALCEVLSKHPDPVVRCSLASCPGTPEKWIRKLAKDPERDVMATARDMLR